MSGLGFVERIFCSLVDVDYSVSESSVVAVESLIERVLLQDNSLHKEMEMG